MSSPSSSSLAPASLLPAWPMARFDQVMSERGWALFEGVLDPDVTAGLREDLAAGYAQCRSVQEANGIVVGTAGTAHHLLGLRPGFLDLLGRQILAPYMARYFDGPYILNSYGGVIHERGSRSYVCNIHRDIRRFVHGQPWMLNMLVLLDDFTEANGATYLYPGSHLMPERPDDEQFFAHAERAVGKAGDVVLFNSGIWHAAGENQTDSLRRGLTLTFTLPFLKPQLDYVRWLGDETVAAMPDHLRQVIGYNARVPASLDEWYQPPDKRFYRPDQG